MESLNSSTSRAPFLLLILAPIAVVAYVVPMIVWGLLSDLVHELLKPRPINIHLRNGKTLTARFIVPPWYVRLGKRLHEAGRDFMVWDRESDRNPALAKVPYLHRHYVTGRRLAGLFSVCLHHFHLSDQDWLHDHPWPYVTIILGGGYWEHMPSGRKVWRPPGSILIRSSRSAHMVELDPNRPPVWTLFIMGPRLRAREWGFRTSRGWVHWDQYLNQRDVLGLRPATPGLPGLIRPTAASANRRIAINRIQKTRQGPPVPLAGIL